MIIFIFGDNHSLYGASQVALMVKTHLPQQTRRDTGSIPGFGRSSGGGHGNQLQYSCLENPMDRGAWWARVHGVPTSQTRLKQLSTYNPWIKNSREKNKIKTLEK